MTWQEELTLDCDHLRAQGRLRKLREITPLGDGFALYENKRYYNLSGNDYMGISADRELRKKFYESYQDFATPELAQSSASSRLLTGNTPAYERLEHTLSELYNHRAALVFNSGYHANIGILPALSRKGDLILSDKLNHASIIDGLQLCEAEYRRYRHFDWEQLEHMLAEKRAQYHRVFLVTESIFSMDGDLADLRKLVELKEKYDAILIVDEAHGVGVRGPHGTGLAAELNVADRVDVLIGTFGKAFGSTGAYAIMEPATREYLVNHMRPLIFTTGLPPVVLNWSDFVLRHCAERDADRAKLARMGNRLRELIRSSGRATDGESQIVPLMIGEDHAAELVAEEFQQKGFLVFPIRPPTVPAGTSRLRFSLSAALDETVIEKLGELL